MRPSLVLFLLGACGDKGGGADTSVPTETDTQTTSVPTSTSLDPATVPLAGSCAQESLWGGFHVTSFFAEDPPYAKVDGKVADGVVPITILTPLAVEGDCQLLRRENPFCDPACDPDETCDFDGTCIPYPATQDLGTVTVIGLAEPVQMEPVSPGFQYFDTSLPFPAWTPGAVITVRTAGGAFDALDLHGVGVEDLEIAPEDSVLARDTPLPIAWTAASAGARSEIYTRITIDQHGVTPVQLTCVTADDGSLEIPATLVTQLIDMGVTGFPNGVIERRTVDSAAIGAGGCADLTVSSPRELRIQVDGVIPCDGPEDCPDGKTCNLTTEVCE